MNKYLVILSLLLTITLLITPVSSIEKGVVEPTIPISYEDIKLLPISDQFNKTTSSGIGYTTDKDVSIVQSKEVLMVTSSSKKSSVIFIPGDIHYRYTISHYVQNLTSMKYYVYDEFVVYPQLIDSDYYVVFDADEWSYYTIDGSLIEVGITDMRLVGDTVEITGDGYDRLILQTVIIPDEFNQKLKMWNKYKVSYPDYFNNPWIKGGYPPHFHVRRVDIISGISSLLYTGNTYQTAAGYTSLSGWYLDTIRSAWIHDTVNDYYQYHVYIDSDHNVAQDVVIESYTPDNIDYFIVEMWNGTAGAYQAVLNDSTYTAANLIHLNNSSAGLDFAFYEGGKRGETVSVLYGNMSKPDKTISAYYGCEERRLILVTLPADDGADSATSGASQVKLRLTVYYNPEGIIDNSNYTNHGTQHGGVTRVRDGYIGEAIEFDGVNDYIDCGNDESLNITDEITLEGWILFETITTSGIIGKRKPGVNSNYGFGFKTSGTKFYFACNISDFVSTSSHGYSTSEWHYVGVVVNESDNTIVFYSDGLKLGNTVTLTTSLTNVSDNMQIGYHATGGPFNGNIDEVRIYNRALNATEVAEHYNGTFNNETGLVFHSPMELTPSGAATYEFSYDTNQYYGLKNLELDATGSVSTLMLAKAGTQNVTYITNESGNAITGMTMRANEDEIIDRLYITYATKPTNISAIINQSAIDIDTDSDGDNVPDAFEDENITANKNAQGGELKWDYIWHGAYNHPNSTGYIYYTNLINGSGLIGTEIQTEITTGTANISMNTAGVGETYNFTVNSGTVDWMNVTSGLDTNSVYILRYSNDTFIEGQSTNSNQYTNFTTDLSAGTYHIDKLSIAVWWFNSTTGVYSNTTTDTVQPCQGFLAYSPENFTWVRSDL